MFAIFNGKYEAFHCLLNNGADPNFVSDYRNVAPLYFATRYCGPHYESDYRYCKELLEKGANPNYGYVIHEAVSNELEYVKFLVEFGADYNVKYYGRSPADDAIIYCQPQIAEYLILEKRLCSIIVHYGIIGKVIKTPYLLHQKRKFLIIWRNIQSNWNIELNQRDIFDSWDNKRNIPWIRNHRRGRFFQSLFRWNPII